MEYTNNIIHEEHKQEFFVANGVRNDSFVKESNGKIGVLSFLFSIFYPIGYFYKQWKAIKKNNEEYKNISPFWRGVFYPFYAFQFTKILDNLLSIKKNKDFSNATNEEEKKKLENEYAVFNKFYSNSYSIVIIPIIVIGLILLNIFTDILPDSTSLRTGINVGVWMSISMTLRNLQKAINKILPQDHPKGKLTFSDFLGFLILIIFLISMLFIFPLFNDPWIEIKGNTLKNTDAKYSITFPFENKKIIRANIGHYCQNNPESKSKDFAICAILIDEFYITIERDSLAKELGKVFQVKFTPYKTALYNDNLGYCFTSDLQEPAKLYTCVMQFKDSPKKGIIIQQNFQDNAENPFENLEKIMNSYQKI